MVPRARHADVARLDRLHGDRQHPTPRRRRVRHGHAAAHGDRRARRRSSAEGDSIAAVLCGASGAPVLPAQLDLPLTYEDFAAAGLGLGSASFIVVDDAVPMARLAASMAHFLAIESCGQCEPCKRDGLALDGLLHEPAWDRAGDRLAPRHGQRRGPLRARRADRARRRRARRAGLGRPGRRRVGRRGERDRAAGRDRRGPRGARRRLDRQAAGLELPGGRAGQRRSGRPSTSPIGPLRCGPSHTPEPADAGRRGRGSPGRRPRLRSAARRPPRAGGAPRRTAQGDRRRPGRQARTGPQGPRRASPGLRAVPVPDDRADPSRRRRGHRRLPGSPRAQRPAPARPSRLGSRPAHRRNCSTTSPPTCTPPSPRSSDGSCRCCRPAWTRLRRRNCATASSPSSPADGRQGLASVASWRQGRLRARRWAAP